MTPSPRRWERMFEYIERTPTVTDVVVSGGDAYMLDPKDLETLGKRLLSIPHVRRIRFGSRGVAFCPGRIIDPQDTWAHTLIRLSNDARNAGKSVALHTHINHPNEINWVTRLAAQRLYRNGVVVRNQAVLLKRVNNELPVLNRLIRELADMNIQPVSVSYHLPSQPTPLASHTICTLNTYQYYVYQLDMVKGVEDLRTPLHEIIDLQKHVQGSIGGMVTPQFVVDLPGGGGKRLVTQFETYDRTTGISKFLSPNVKGGKDAQGKERVYEYHDPLWSLNPQGSS